MQPTTLPMTTTSRQPAVVIQGMPITRQNIKVTSSCINNQATGLGITQLILGIVCIAFNIAAIAIGTSTAYPAAGIWSGIMFAIAGSIGIAAGRTKKRPWYVAFMVNSIISASLTAAVVIQSSIGLSFEVYRYIPIYDPDYCYWVPCWVRDPKGSEKVAMHSVLLVCGCLEAAFFIWSSILCCKVVCCGTAQMTTVPGQTVVYHGGMQPVAQPGQQVMLVNQAQPAVTYATSSASQQQFATVPFQAQPLPTYEEVSPFSPGMATVNDNQQNQQKEEQDVPLSDQQK